MVSSSDCICSSTMVLISGVITVGLPDPEHLTMVLVCLYWPISLAMPSSSNKGAIDGAR